MRGEINISLFGQDIGEAKGKKRTTIAKMHMNNIFAFELCVFVGLPVGTCVRTHVWMSVLGRPLTGCAWTSFFAAGRGVQKSTLSSVVETFETPGEVRVTLGTTLIL